MTEAALTEGRGDRKKTARGEERIEKERGESAPTIVEQHKHAGDGTERKEETDRERDGKWRLSAYPFSSSF